MIDFTKLSPIEKEIIENIRKGKPIYINAFTSNEYKLAINNLVMQCLIVHQKTVYGVDVGDTQNSIVNIEYYKLKDVFCILEIPIDHSLIADLLKDENVKDITTLISGVLK